MIYPSELLRRLADRMERLEEDVEQRLLCFRRADDVRHTIRSLESELRSCRREYERLAGEYRRKTGEDPPPSWGSVSLHALLLEDARRIQESLRRLGARARASHGERGGRPEK